MFVSNLALKTPLKKGLETFQKLLIKLVKIRFRFVTWIYGLLNPNNTSLPSENNRLSWDSVCFLFGTL